MSSTVTILRRSLPVGHISFTMKVIKSRLWTGIPAPEPVGAEARRYQLAFTLGEIHPPDRIRALSEILRRDLESTWVQAAVLNSLTEGVDEMVAAISTDQRVLETKPGREFFRQLVLLVGVRNQSNEVSRTLQRLARLDEPGLTFSLAAALGDGLQQAGSSLKRSGANLAGLFGRAAGIARDDHASELSRVQAINFWDSPVLMNPRGCFCRFSIRINLRRFNWRRSMHWPALIIRTSPVS